MHNSVLVCHDQFQNCFVSKWCSPKSKAFRWCVVVIFHIAKPGMPHLDSQCQGCDDPHGLEREEGLERISEKIPVAHGLPLGKLMVIVDSLSLPWVKWVTWLSEHTIIGYRRDYERKKHMQDPRCFQCVFLRSYIIFPFMDDIFNYLLPDFPSSDGPLPCDGINPSKNAMKWYHMF